MATGTLYGHSSSFRTQQILIAAKYGGSKVTLASNMKPGETEKSDAFLKKFPFGKLPAFETPEGRRLFETNAITTFVAGSMLSKDASAIAEVQQWMTLAEAEVYPAVAAWVFPCLSLIQHNKQTVDEARGNLLKFLESLDHYLLSRTYLVGERISIADITLSMHLLLAFQHVLDASTRQKLINVTRWFETMVNQPEFKAVIGEVHLCEKVEQFDAKKFKASQQVAAPQTAPAGKKAKEEASPKPPAAADAPKPQAAKKDKKATDEHNGQPAPAAPAHPEEEMDASEEALALEPKKKDPFDDFPKGTLNLEEFKRVYSNNDTMTVAIPWFWEHFDKENFSLWICEYKFPKELTMVYMSCNLISGMFQRIDKMRKNAFGSMCLFGTDNNSTISGVWVWRGHKLAFELSDDWQTDFESYTWKKLDANSPETKKIVTEYFSWEGDFGGKKFNQGKIFK